MSVAPTWTSNDGSVQLFLGDCRDILLHLQDVDAVVTDPPYGLRYVSNHRKAKYAAIANDDTTDLLKWACHIPVRHSRYVFCRWDNLRDVPKPKSLVTWVKNNWSMGDLKHEHARQTEVVCFYPGESHHWPASRPTDVVYAARSGNKHHPTEKPIALKEAVVGWTEGVVCDPFMGSGSTGVACVRLGRRFIGVEQKKTYFEIAKQRIQEALAQAVIQRAG